MNVNSILTGVLATTFVIIYQPRAIAKLFPGIYFSETDIPGSPTDPNAIKRANLDGSQLITIGTADASFGIDSSQVTQLIYWTDSKSAGPGRRTVTEQPHSVNDLIASAIADGGNRQNLVTTDLQLPFGVSIDDSARKLYWSDSLTGKVERASFDGTTRELVVQVPVDGKFLRALHVDDRNGDVYFGRQYDGLYKLPSGTSNPVKIVDGASPFGLDIDPIEDRIYWTDVQLDVIRSSKLDGTDVRTLVDESINLLGGLSLDLSARTLYWADQLQSTINRINLDGSEREVLIQLEHRPFAVEAVSVPEPGSLELVIAVLTSLCFYTRRLRRCGNPLVTSALPKARD
jgi:sugar lactone lactonase YvrE